MYYPDLRQNVVVLSTLAGRPLKLKLGSLQITSESWWVFPRVYASLFRISLPLRFLELLRESTLPTPYLPVEGKKEDVM
jgi:hypothetical protein